MKLTLIKQLNNTFKVANDSDYEKAKKIKVGEPYQCDIKQPRNYKFHRKFFALINMVFQNQDVFINIDHLREELTKAAGYYDTYINHKNITCYKAKSISFTNMNQEEFEGLYDRFLDVIVEAFKWDKQTIEDNLNDFY
ncbi:MAG: DUF1367 family protein [Cyclobacteriaceae bacterium]